jgi:hypothetical protein
MNLIAIMLFRSSISLFWSINLLFLYFTFLLFLVLVCTWFIDCYLRSKYKRMFFNFLIRNKVSLWNWNNRWNEFCSLYILIFLFYTYLVYLKLSWMQKWWLRQRLKLCHLIIYNVLINTIVTSLTKNKQNSCSISANQ